MKIWVAYRDFGAYDGKSEPLAAFAIEREKDAYLAGAAASDIGSMLVREFDVPMPEIFPKPSPLAPGGYRDIPYRSLVAASDPSANIPDDFGR